MAIRLSTGMRNASLDSGLATQLDSGVVEWRTGAQPASANDAPTGTVVATFPLPADAFTAAAAGAIAKSGTWQDTSADASGTAGWFRMRTTGDGGGSSSTDKRIDGSITATGGGGDLTVDNPVIASGQQVTINTFGITQPAS